LIISQGML